MMLMTSSHDNNFGRSGRRVISMVSWSWGECISFSTALQATTLTALGIVVAQCLPCTVATALVEFGRSSWDSTGMCPFPKAVVTVCPSSTDVRSADDFLLCICSLVFIATFYTFDPRQGRLVGHLSSGREGGGCEYMRRRVLRILSRFSSCRKEAQAEATCKHDARAGMQ